MERQWYLARDGHVFGPVTDAQLMESASTGRVLPTDQLNIAGEPNWTVASAIPWLFPPAPPAGIPLIESEVVEELPPEPEPVTLKVTCMACFRDVKVTVMPTDASTFCPKCRSPIALAAQPVENAPAPTGNQAAFEKLESKKDFKKRMQKKVAATQPPANNAAAMGGIIGAILSNGGG